MGRPAEIGSSVGRVSLVLLAAYGRAPWIDDYCSERPEVHPLQ
jgi:hypothetical protein